MSEAFKIAIVWRGDRQARDSATPQNNRYVRIFEELAALGIIAEPAVYDEAFADEVREQLVRLSGVLVFVNPLQDGKTREQFDAMLRAVAANGVWISAHPDVVLKMGTKEVLYRTRAMSWGSDTDMYPTLDAMRVGLLARLPVGPRVIKRNRGNGGQGVWKVSARPAINGEVMVQVMDATEDVPEDLPLASFLERCASYFDDGNVIDQPFQGRLTDGVVRCYMVGDRCAGFGSQKVKALVTGPARSEATSRTYSSNADPRFQRLRMLVEDQWTPQLVNFLDLGLSDLPIVWDADFMLGPPDADRNDTYVLGEINVSCVFPIPDEAAAAMARLSLLRCRLRTPTPAA